MTTVAFRDGVMAADSRGTDDDAGICRVTKLFRKKVGKKEHIIGVAGDLYAALLFVDWYGTGTSKPPDAMAHLCVGDTSTTEDFTALIWTGRKLFAANRLCRLVEVEDPYFAAGSGAGYALAAMDCGKSAKDAVRIACRRDNYSGLPVVAMSLVPAGTA